MANKIINIKSNRQQLSASSYIATYRDISLVSQQKYYAKKPNSEDFQEILRLENTIDDLTIATTEQSEVEGRFAINLTDNRVYYDKLVEYNKQIQLKDLIDVEAVKNSIHNIFTWIQGERILDPEFGSTLRQLLYEGITEYNKDRIAAEIRNLISKYEPRVSIENIYDNTATDDEENNTVVLQIKYSIPALTGSNVYSETLKYNTKQI